MDKHGLA